MRLRSSTSWHLWSVVRLTALQARPRCGGVSSSPSETSSPPSLLPTTALESPTCATSIRSPTSRTMQSTAVVPAVDGALKVAFGGQAVCASSMSDWRSSNAPRSDSRALSMEPAPRCRARGQRSFDANSAASAPPCPSKTPTINPTPGAFSTSTLSCCSGRPPWRSALPTLSTRRREGPMDRVGDKDAWDSHSRLCVPLGDGGDGSVAEPRLPLRDSEGDAAEALPESMAAPGDHSSSLLVGLEGGAGDGVGASEDAFGVSGGGGRGLTGSSRPRAAFGAVVAAWGGFGEAGVSKSGAAASACVSAASSAGSGGCIASVVVAGASSGEGGSAAAARSACEPGDSIELVLGASGAGGAAASSAVIQPEL
mmetsp:Transcript_19246/g.50074  ORF Transcript_19246/g.50074 Transcript_19246/m.50074 type:complete len:368 (-) Transcript_19246:66-1169(-)